MRDGPGRFHCPDTWTSIRSSECDRSRRRGICRYQDAVHCSFSIGLARAPFCGGKIDHFVLRASGQLSFRCVVARLTTVEQLISGHLESTVDQKPDQGIRPNQPGIAPADRRDEPAVDGGKRAQQLSRLGYGEELPAGLRPLPNWPLIAS